MRKTKTARRCLLDPAENRPCDKCKKRSSTLRFHDGPYEFWTVEFGADDSLTCRVPPWRNVDHRLMTLGPEIERELRGDREAVWKEAKKYGIAWTVLSLARIGSAERRYRQMLAGIEGTKRAACVCEIANWINGHDEDRENLKTDLNKSWAGMIEE